MQGDCVRGPDVPCPPPHHTPPTPSTHTLPTLAPHACRVIVYEGQPSKEATACSPQSLLSGARACVCLCVFECLCVCVFYEAGVWGAAHPHSHTHMPCFHIFAGMNNITNTLHLLLASPTCTHAGMNSFLKNLNITFRRDPTNFRPRINKKDSTKDREQKV